MYYTIYWNGYRQDGDIPEYMTVMQESTSKTWTTVKVTDFDFDSMRELFKDKGTVAETKEQDIWRS